MLPIRLWYATITTLPESNESGRKFILPEREFVMFSAKPVMSGSATTDANVINSLSGTQKIFLPFS